MGSASNDQPEVGGWGTRGGPAAGRAELARRARSGLGRAAPAVTALAGLAIAHGGPGVTAIGPIRRALFPGLAGLGRPDHVALTFDDGPDPRSTPAFLDLLGAQRVRATFFLLGSMVARTPQLPREIAAAGHEIAVHGYDHRYSVLRTPWAAADDLARAFDLIAEASGAAPRFYRPPYGVLSTGAVLAARRLGLTPVLWTSWGREWVPGATPGSVYHNVMRSLGAGACVLLHDSDCTSPAGTAQAALGALPWLLEECSRRGLAAGALADHGI